MRSGAVAFISRWIAAKKQGAGPAMGTSINGRETDECSTFKIHVESLDGGGTLLGLVFVERCAWRLAGRKHTVRKLINAKWMEVRRDTGQTPIKSLSAFNFARKGMYAKSEGSEVRGDSTLKGHGGLGCCWQDLEAPQKNRLCRGGSRDRLPRMRSKG